MLLMHASKSRICSRWWSYLLSTTLDATSSNGIQGTNNTAMPLTLSIKNLTPNQINNHVASIHVSFNATNPNRGAEILEAIEYSIMFDDKPVASGTIGKRLERFLKPSPGVCLIIGEGSVILKDNQLFQKINPPQ